MPGLDPTSRTCSNGTYAILPTSPMRLPFRSCFRLWLLVRAAGLISPTYPHGRFALKRYFALLETMFLLQPLRPGFRNLGKRLIQSPKVCLNDSGPLAYLPGAPENFIKARSRLGSREANGQKSIRLAD